LQKDSIPIENEVPNKTIVNNKTICFKVTSLPVADFIIQNDNEEIMMAFERKTLQDLSSSILDGRFREQKKRLLDSISDPSKITYIIENCSGSSSHKLQKNILNGAILNLIYKHNYKVLQTTNSQNTFEMLTSLYTKYATNDIDIIGTSKKLIKRSESAQNNKFINQLTLITGVSPNIASKIAEKYISLKSLMDAYNEAEGEKESLLAYIQINKTRKIGKALSKKIYEWFCL
jgi:ERCC4-type nuclease